jgi:outer membrane lipoprotein-sorting protein
LRLFRLTCSIAFALCLMLTLTTGAASPFIGGTEEPCTIDSSQLLDKVITTYTEIKELRIVVRIEIMDPNSSGEAVSDYIIGEVLYRRPDVLRLTYLEPMEWADYFILIDKSKDTIKRYQPVTDRLFVESLSRAAKDNVGLSLDSLLTPPKKEDVLKVNQMTDLLTDKQYYVVHNRTQQYDDLGVQKFWLDPETSLIKQVHLYNLEEKLLLRGVVLEMEINPNIQDADLFFIPLEAEVTQR